MTEPNTKRHAFKKDIDKMMSNDYVLVPIKLTDEMLNTATTIFNATPQHTCKYHARTNLGKYDDTCYQCKGVNL